jgi:2-dehydro-3-deoxygluconokinase
MTLTIRAAGAVDRDCLVLGEVMLRLDPGEGRIRSARSFQVWEGGGEYNVGRALASVFGRRCAAVTALPDNELGRLCLDLMRAGGVEVSDVLMRPADPIGRDVRMGLNFTERGFGARAALGVSDRARSAAARIGPEDFDWPALMARTRWLHTGGIFAALSERTAEAALAAVRAAKDTGVVVSHDLNHRASLWAAHPDPDAARRVNRQIVEMADVVFGDEYAWQDCMGFDRGADREDALDAAPFDALVGRVASEFPHVRIFAATLRDPHSASRNGWGAVLWTGGERFEAPARDVDVLDRVGGGDGFAAGVIHALMDGRPGEDAVRTGWALGALVMTTPGDAAQCSAEEVAALAAGGKARARR